MIRAIIALTIFAASPANATRWKHPPPNPAQTQGDCIAAYLAVCGNVPLNEAAIRACFIAHKFSPECMELAKGIK